MKAPLDSAPCSSRSRNCALTRIAVRVLGTSLCWLAFAHPNAAIALQQTDSFTISGTVSDQQSGETLIGAAIYVPALERGSTTNQYGFFSISVPADSVTVVVSHLGYHTLTLTRFVDSDLRLDLALDPASLFLDEIEVVAQRAESHVSRTQMSRVDLPANQIEAVPALLGEVDILRVIQLLPGVQSGMEGTTGIYVRGGGPDQNLFVLDGTQIYNPSHLFGFLSTFNGDAIKDVSLLKGGFPARYGGRLSSVVDLTMKEGNLKEYEGTATIGLLSSRFTVEGPVKEDRASFLVAGRRSYADLLARPFMRNREETFGYYFYDLNAKSNIILSPRDRLYISLYGGRDRAYFKYRSKSSNINRDENSALGWRNQVATLRWNRVLGPRMFANTTVGFTRYRLLSKTEEEFDQDYYESSYISGIRDWHARADLEYTSGARHYVRFGAAGILHSFLTGALTERYDINDVPVVDTTYTPNRITQAVEFQAYAEDEVRLTRRIKVNVGVHASGFVVEREDYWSVQPRLSVWFGLDERSSLKASFAMMQQYIHLLATTRGLTLPTDLWVPATNRVRPQSANQTAVGYARTFRDGRFEVTLEGFYKRIQNVIEYKTGASYLNAAFDSWQDKVTSGKGWAYGGEFFIQKKTGRTTGWIGYTLSWTERKFEELNQGKPFPYRYDRRHDMSMVSTHRLRPSLELSAAWVYGTGQAITLPVGHQVLDVSQHTVPRLVHWYYPDYFEILSDRNAIRIPAYHRLDFSVRWRWFAEWADQSLSVGAYNVYSRRNPFTVYTDTDDESGEVQFKKISLLPIIPSISYQLRF